jgi:ATP-dependent helicase/DNAse subunit B
MQSPLRISPPIVAVLELLRAVNDDFPRLSTSIALSSPYYPRIPNETKRWAPYYAKRASIIKGKGAWQTLARLLKESGQIERKEWILISRVQKGIEIFLAQLAGLKRDATLSEHANGLRKTLTKLGFDTDRGVNHRTSEAKNKFFEILSAVEYMERCLGETTCNLSHFLKTIDYLVSRIKCPAERKLDGVKVMGLLETRGIDAQNIFFGGLIEGRFPGHPQYDPILPEKTKINMGLPNIDRYLKRQKLHYFRLCNSSINKAHLSYPTTEGDRLLLPTPFFEGKIISAIRGEHIFSQEEEMRMWGGRENMSLTFEGADFSGDSEIKDCLRKRFGSRSYVSVTGLERYRHCPYLFYLENVLGLRIGHEPTYEVEAKIWGTLAHKVLAFLYKDGSVSLDSINERILACTEKALSEERLPKFWEEVARKIFRNITAQFIAYETAFRKEGFHPIKIE